MFLLEETLRLVKTPQTPFFHEFPKRLLVFDLWLIEARSHGKSLLRQEGETVPYAVRSTGLKGKNAPTNLFPYLVGKR
jgi:hypothetical protein